MGVKSALGGLYSTCEPMWRDGEENASVCVCECVCGDVTLGYDLSTCLLRLSSDQSSLCQPPLPAGNFSMHVSPHPSVSHSLSLSRLFLLIFSLSSWSLSNLSSFDSISGLPCSALLIFSASAMRPSLYLPLCAFPHIISPGPLVSFSLPCSRLV